MPSCLRQTQSAVFRHLKAKMAAEGTLYVFLSVIICTVVNSHMMRIWVWVRTAFSFQNSHVHISLYIRCVFSLSAYNLIGV